LYTKIIHGQWGCQIFFYFFSIHKVFKIFFRRKASPFIDKSGAKPPIFSQNQHQSQKKGFFLLILTENAGFSPAFIYEAEGFV